jgi:O-antigen/teichoic acid export membrane protein
MKDLKDKAVRGGFAKLCAQGANLVIRVGSLVVLARLLNPTDFGLVAMVTAVTGLLNLFRDFGLSTATIQQKDITEGQISTLFWINVIIGVALAGVAAAGAGLIARFYHEPRLVWVTVALAASFLFNAIGVQHAALLKRQMRFTTLSVIDIVSLTISVVVGIGMALGGLGYWALVGMTVVLPLINSLFVWVAAAWVPGWPQRQAGIRSMLRFGGTITLNGLVVYAAYNLEKVLLGRFWGADALGIYGRAYQLVNIPTENLNSAVGEVAFSALSRIKDDIPRLKSYFLKGYSLVVAFTLPITIACALFANDLILVILGPKWVEAVPIFRFLAPTILIFAMINPMWWLLVSLGLAGRSLKIALVLAPLVMASYLVGLPYGPTGVAIAYSSIMTLWVIPHILWCIHGTVISLKDIVLAVSRPLFSAFVAAAVAGGAAFYFPESMSHVTRLLVALPILLLVYVGMLFYAMGQKSFYLDLVTGLMKRPVPPKSHSVGLI